MANIDNELNQIKNAVYGKDVRGSIHDGIDKINKETEVATDKSEQAHDVMESIINDGFDNAALESNFEQKLDDKIADLQPEWTQFKDDTSSQLAQTEHELINNKNEVNTLKINKAEKLYVDEQIRNAGNLSPKGAFYTITELENAYPNGAEGLYLVRETNMWYFWDDVNWVEGEIYQAAITNDFPVKNLVSDGDFSGGGSGWFPSSGAEKSIVGNKLLLTGIQDSTASVRFDIENSRGADLFYLKTNFRVSNQVCDQIRFYYSNPSLGEVNLAVIDNPEEGKTYNVSEIIEIGQASEGVIRFYYRHVYHTESNIGKTLEVGRTLAINLSKDFGFGNEPKVEEMESYLLKYPFNWFGGTVSPFVDQRELLLKVKQTDVTLDNTNNRIDFIENNLIKIDHKKPFPLKIKYELIDNWGSTGRRFKYVDHNNFIWATNTLGRVEKSEDYGITWETVLEVDRDTHGEIYLQALVVTDEGRILIGTDTGKVLVSSQHQDDYWVGFQFDKGGRFSAQLGYKNYGDIVLIGGYTSTATDDNESNEVYMSKDSGASWRRIFKGAVIDNTVNQHIHDVEYDFWDNRIFISVGDLRNRNLFYSDDEGDTWVKLFSDSEWDYKTNIQPTQILAYPHGIVFGSDDREYSGLHYLPRKRGLNQPINKDDIIPNFYPIPNGSSGAPAIFAVRSARVVWNETEISLMPFRFMHEDNRSRLLTSADGYNWFEIWRADSEVVGLQNIHTIFISGELHMLGDFIGDNGDRFVFKAKVPDFI